MRKGDFKLIEFFESGTIELYNLKTDPEEKNDLSGKGSQRAKTLHDELKQIQAQFDAPRPTAPNPDYDPSTVRKKGRDQRGKGKKNK